MEIKQENVKINELAPVIEEIISRGGKFSLTVTGKSMFPLFIENRDSVVLEKAYTVRNHDVIFYRRDNGDYVLHRIVKIKNGELYLCGDNQMAVEYPVRYDQIIAKVSGFCRKGKNVSVKNIKYRFCVFCWCINVKWRPFIMKTFFKIKRGIK